MEWISVKDRLPEEDCHCIIAFKTGKSWCGHYYKDSKAFESGGYDLTDIVMWWMPLPDRPKPINNLNK